MAGGKHEKGTKAIRDGDEGQNFQQKGAVRSESVLFKNNVEIT